MWLPGGHVASFGFWCVGRGVWASVRSALLSGAWGSIGGARLELTVGRSAASAAAASHSVPTTSAPDNGPGRCHASLWSSTYPFSGLPSAFLSPSSHVRALVQPSLSKIHLALLSHVLLLTPRTSFSADMRQASGLRKRLRVRFSDMLRAAVPCYADMSCCAAPCYAVPCAVQT